MPYIVRRASPVYRQVTLEEILAGYVEPERFAPVRTNTTGTITHFVKELPLEFVEKFNIVGMVRVLQEFNEKYADLRLKNRRTLYHHFEIEKKSIDPTTGRHKTRPIDEPCPELKNALYELKAILEHQCGAMYHTSAYAYVTGRCTVDSIKRHQENVSHWFLKTDFSNFFGNTTPDFVFNMLSMIFPFSEMWKSDAGKEALQTAMSLCFLNGGLPQGSPISPMLTNLVMIPIDHRLANTLRKYEKTRFVYTRYADDILISSKVDFAYQEIVAYISSVLTEFKAPFQINAEKTRYGSGNGHNFNLGVILNENNEITIGWKKKQAFRAMLSDFIKDRLNDMPGDLREQQIVNGLLSYYSSIEPEYWKLVVERFNKRFKIDLIAMLREPI